MIDPFAQHILIDLSRMWAPEETVGYLILRDRMYDRVGLLLNRSKSPESNFQIRIADVYDIMLLYGMENVAIWHSHPKGRAIPSYEDISLVRQLGKTRFVIVGLFPIPHIRLYGWEGERIVEVRKFRVNQEDHAHLS